MSNFFDDIDDEMDELPQPKKDDKPETRFGDLDGVLENPPKPATTKPTSEAKQARDRLANMLENVAEFDAQEYMIERTDLPAREVKIVNYEEKLQGLAEQSGSIIDVYCRNYIKADEIFNLERLQVLRNEQKEKLADIYFLQEASKEGMIGVKELIDAGDNTAENNKLMIQYMGEIRTNLELRTKHLKEVESYWERLAERLGIEDTTETEAMDKIVEIEEQKEEKAEDKPKHNIRSIRDMNAMIDKAMKDMKNDRSK